MQEEPGLEHVLSSSLSGRLFALVLEFDCSFCAVMVTDALCLPTTRM